MNKSLEEKKMKVYDIAFPIIDLVFEATCFAILYISEAIREKIKKIL